LRIRKVMLVFRKDWREVRRNWQVILPIVIGPLLLSAVLPSFLLLVPAGESSSSDIGEIARTLPSNVLAEIAGMTGAQAFAYLMTVYFFAPFFMIIPLMTSSVIASDSFAGEKERKTIEALLAMPFTDGELFLGKILVAFVPSMIVTIISFATYSTVVDILGFNLFNGRILLPNLLWVLLIFGLAPAVALSSIGLTVMISAKVKGFREAQQISTVLLLPILILFFSQLSGAIFLGPLVLLGLIGGFGLVAAVVVQIGVKLFAREKILSKLA